MNDQLTSNRLYIDLIHGRQFNKGQREAIKKACESKLNITQLGLIAKPGYTKEHINEFVKFFESNKYSDNKMLFDFFSDKDIDHKVLEQINKGLENGLSEIQILEYAKPQLFSPEQMNELRLFLNSKDIDKEYHDFIFDKDKGSESMKEINKAYRMQVPLEDINCFDDYSDLYPTMVNAICEGILPQEVDMILNVSKDKKVFDAIVNGYSLGLSDDEISVCLKEQDLNHLSFNLELMAECHDPDYIDKILSISEIKRRDFIENFGSENDYFSYLIEVFENSKLDASEQEAIYISECGHIDEKKLLTKDGYFEEHLEKVLKDAKKLSNLQLKSLLLSEINQEYEINRLPEVSTISSMIESIYHKKYDDLVNKKEDMNYFLQHVNQIELLLDNRIGEVKVADNNLNFYMCEDFEICLKECKNYYDLDKVIIHYGDNKVCEFNKKWIEESEKEFKRLHMNEHGKFKKMDIQHER